MPARDPTGISRLFAERASAGDLEGLMALYEDGAKFVGPDGGDADGRDAIRERLEGLLAMAPRITSTESGAVRAGDVALLSNRWRMTLGEGDEGRAGLEGISTEVVRRQGDGSWLYVIDDLSSVALGPHAARGILRAGDPSGFEQLIFQEDGPVARITLNRPERRNALSMRLSDELIAALERVRASETIKVLVIAGAGETFCAGDGGLEITMACDFVVATRRAVWGMPEVDVGITPGWGGTTRMARLIGRRMTKEINVLGALHPASRAAELGLWNRIVDDGRLEVEVDALIELVLAKNQQAVRQLKFIINNGVEADLHTAQAFEALSAGLTGAVNGAWQVEDADQAAGVVSFVTDGERWRSRRAAARGFWTDGPIPAGAK
jgi:enoyl-CoA hydratase